MTQWQPSTTVLIVVQKCSPVAWSQYKFMALEALGPNTGQLLQRHLALSQWLLGHSGCHQRSWLPCLIKRGGDDIDGRVIPLHITSFIKGLPWPSKGDGQWSSIPPATHPETPIPLCPTPSPSAHSGGKLLWAGGIQLHWDGERAVQKRVKFKKLSLFFYGSSASLEGIGG